MSFLWIEALWALLLVPALAVAYILVQRRRRRYALRYASLSLVKEALGRGPGVRRHIPPALFLVALTIMVFAMARPVTTVTLPSQQGTVILALDVSGSMRADDLKPSRLEAAKAAARAFVDKQPKNVRIGVVSFSNNASVVQAPTTDREPVRAAIDRLAMQRATAIGSGILTSLDAIVEDADQKPSSVSRDPFGVPQPTASPTPLPSGTFAAAVIVLLSDGQSNAGPDPIQAAKQAAHRGVRVYTVGVGSPEGTVQRFEGRSVRVRLDEETLKRIAEETDASYFKADSESYLRDIYENLSTHLVFKTEQTEVTAELTGVAAVLMLLAGSFSLLWFNRLP